MLPGASQAWDGHRQGFIFGGGLGGGTTVLSKSYGDIYLMGMATTLKAGFAPSDQIMIHYWGQQIWLAGGNYTGTIAAPCLGITYFHSETAPSMFYTIGAGPVFLGAVGMDEISDGTSLFLAVGRELQPHWSVELNLGYSWFEYDLDSLEGRVLVTILGY